MKIGSKAGTKFQMEQQVQSTKFSLSHHPVKPITCQSYSLFISHLYIHTLFFVHFSVMTLKVTTGDMEVSGPVRNRFAEY